MATREGSPACAYRLYQRYVHAHLPSRTVFIDADGYGPDDSLGYWLTNELGHLETNSAKETDAERAAAEYQRLKGARQERFIQKIGDGDKLTLSDSPRL